MLNKRLLNNAVRSICEPCKSNCRKTNQPCLIYIFLVYLTIISIDKIMKRQKLRLLVDNESERMRKDTVAA
jgi:hypothetical protein